MAERRGQKVGLIYLDLDNFKWLNETSGHAVGDLLLQQFAERVRGQLRDEDSLARIGGDEFVALVECDSGADVAAMAVRMLASMAKPFLLHEHQTYLTTSIGISLYPDDGKDVAQLVRCADAALYRAKEQGKNAYQFFTDEMNTRARHHLMVETGIRRGLEGKEFYLEYQPQISLSTGRTVGVEALVRWNHPQLGLVAPATFIPVAEESDLILRLGDWVMEEACRQLAQWRKDGVRVPQVSVNLSARQFRLASLPGRVKETLTRHGLSAAQLGLELTEGTLMANDSATADTLRALAGLGVTLSLDDFGTGYSSLSYLKRYPIDVLKIDKSFVEGIATDPNDLAIASAIVGMARSLQLTTVAEGVETFEQLEVLKERGCDQVQGYFVARPMKPEALEIWLGSSPYPAAD